ncbi:uncharacterized protein LOC142349446 [Convolutriloba macropyga]|uniref:uncharacterized protein LOC142349446 n=1 Tax=Convolutriloba macropyga TaxID=536237 RepID=UPI003F521A66
MIVKIGLKRAEFKIGESLLAFKSVKMVFSRISRQLLFQSKSPSKLSVVKRGMAGASKDPVPDAMLYPICIVFFSGAVWYYMKLNGLEEEVHKKYGKVDGHH